MKRKHLLLSLVLGVLVASDASGRVYTTNGSQLEVTAALTVASSGDTVLISGTHTYGTGGISLFVPAGVTLDGQGTAVLNMAASSPSGYGNALFTLAEGAVVRRLTLNGPDADNCIPFRSGAKDWRVSGITYNQHAGRASYFMQVNSSLRGLIDSNVINGAHGQSEMIFSRGPADAWDVPDTMGTANNIFIEDNVFNGVGYINDANSNSRVVVRFNQINGALKTDSHGVWSNTPARGARHSEIYHNSWTGGGSFASIELRGGGGRVFNNTSNASVGANTTHLIITEYGVFNNNGVFTNYQTAYDWPIRDQIGRGKYAVAGDWTTATSEPMYIWGNRKGGQFWPWTNSAIPGASQTRFKEQMGDSGATFGWMSIIQPDRDYFVDVPSFDGSSGIGTGTKAQMRAITGRKVGVGFWVTDEGDWNLANGSAKDGQLYTWSGSAWVLAYTPYPYPHPMRSSEAPWTAASSAAAPSPGSTVSAVPPAASSSANSGGKKGGGGGGAPSAWFVLALGVLAATRCCVGRKAA